MSKFQNDLELSSVSPKGSGDPSKSESMGWKHKAGEQRQALLAVAIFLQVPALSGPVSSLQTHPSPLIGSTQKHGTLDLVFYYFLFCFKAICLIFTYKNIYMVHFVFTISSSWHLKVLVGVGNAQPIFGYRWSFLFSCPLPTSIVGGFPWNVSSLNTTWLQIPKGISQKEEEEVGLSLLSP